MVLNLFASCYRRVAQYLVVLSDFPTAFCKLDSINNRSVRLSIVIPAYNAARCIGNALSSIHAALPTSHDAELEILVVDDGSDDVLELEKIVARVPSTKIIKHGSNRGMCAARNSGIAASSGEYVTLLDADDEFVDDWFSVFRKVLTEWPASAQVCYTPCLNDEGQLTCARPDYRGWLTAEDIVMERFTGEYNPIFRGDYVRSRGYDDLGTRKSCGLLSYLRMAREAPFWITDAVMRRYHDMVEQSVTRGWTRPEKAAETYRCFASVLATHGDFIRGVAPEKYLQMRQKLLVYKMLSRQGRDFAGWWQVRSWRKSWVATLGLLLIGRAGSARLLGVAKRFNMLRRYG